MGYIFNEDIQQIITDTKIPWTHLTDSVVFVSGATGLIGSALIKALSAADKYHNLSMRIIGHGRNITKGRILSDEYGIEFLAGNICNPSFAADITSRIDYLFHCAALTQSTDMVSKPIDVMLTAADGTRNMLELAIEKKVKDFIYLSSMEVYGQISAPEEVKETDLGYLDLSAPRSSYPESKRFCESLCIAYAKQYNVPVKIARLARTFGAGTPNEKNDNRVAMQFARNALAGKDIVMHTQGKSIANCCYTSDTISALFTILLKGENGEAYNVVNPSACVSVREMAEIVAQSVGNGKISVVVDIPTDIANRGYAPNVTMRLNADKLKNLGWKPKYSLSEMYERMTKDWIEANE